MSHEVRTFSVDEANDATTASLRIRTSVPYLVVAEAIDPRKWAVTEGHLDDPTPKRHIEMGWSGWVDVRLQAGMWDVSANLQCDYNITPTTSRVDFALESSPSLVKDEGSIEVWKADGQTEIRTIKTVQFRDHLENHIVPATWQWLFVPTSLALLEALEVK